MSEDKKTIQEALAEVQKNAELKKVEEAKKVWGDALQIDEAMAAVPPPNFDPPAISGQRMAGTVKRSGTATGRFIQPQRVTANAPGKTPSRALVPTGGRTPVASSSSPSPSAPSGSKGLTTTSSTSVAPSAASAPKTGFAGKLPTEHGFRAHSIPGSGGAAAGAGDKVRNFSKYLGPIGAAAIGGAQASNILGGLATGTETGRNIGKAIGELPGAQTAANLMRKAGEAIGVRPKAEPETPAPSAAPSAAPKAETTPKVAVPAPSAASKAATSTPAPSAAPKAAPSTAKEVPTIKAPSEPAKVAPSAAPKTADASATTTKGGYFTKSPNVSKGDYTIKSGDTLSDIAKSHGTSVGAIQSMNKGLTDVNKIAAGGSLNLPTSSKADITPATSTAPAKSETPIKDFVRDTMQGKVETPIKDAIKSKIQPEYESGGKKKKMSEETNPLIAAFLNLQAKNPENMFVEAKKLSKKQDEKLDVVDDDKIDAKDLAALRAGKKKVDEGSLPTMAKPSANADVKQVTTDFSAPDRPAVTMDNKPSTPAQTAAATSGPSASDKKALDSKIKSIAKEEVTFSQAEIDHINSFFLEASVAPTRPEVAREADSTSEGMSQNDVTGTHTESGKKKVKEEVEQIEEGRPKKNPTPETTERDPRQHIQVAAGRAAAGNVVDFPHNNGTTSKITPGMGRKITAHLNGLKPADRQAAVNKMHDSAEGLKV